MTPLSTLSELIRTREQCVKGDLSASQYFHELSLKFAETQGPKLVERVKELEAALQWYADRDNYRDVGEAGWNEAWRDGGNRARQALQTGDGE